MPATSAPAYYPKANHTAQNFGAGNSNMGTINKILLHSTETESWPAYGGAGGHPTLTYNPWLHEWRQHLSILGSATALMNDGSFQTNRDHVVQIEIVGYSDPATARKYGHFIDDIDDAALKDLGEFVAWMHTHYGVKIANTVTWKKYPASYGNSNGVRLGLTEFKAYRGVLGHQHAPGNYHGDPGDIAIAKIIDHAHGSTPAPSPSPKPAPKPKPAGDGYRKPTSGEVYLDKLKPGTKDSDSAYYWRMAMNAIHLTSGKDLPLNGDFSADLEHETKLFQAQKCGDPQDGWPGPKQAELGFQLAEKEMKAKGVKHLSIYKSSAKGELIKKCW